MNSIANEWTPSLSLMSECALEEMIERRRKGDMNKRSEAEREATGEGGVGVGDQEKAGE